MDQPERRPPVAGLLILALLVGVGGGVLLDREVLHPATAGLPAPGTPAANAGPNVALLDAAWQVINRYYVDRPAVQSQTLTYGAIAGMVDALGDTGHTRFQTPADRVAEQHLAEGSFQGIGAEVEMKNGRVTIVAPIDGSPAQRAGLRPGDVMVQVNGKSVEGLTLEQVVSQVLGPAGTTVRLQIFTPATNQTRDVSITRAVITLHNVTWQRLPGTTLADVRIAEFSKGVSDDLQKDLAAIEQQHLTGIVLDLRNDPGGLLDEAEKTASAFLKSGTVLEEKNAQGQVTPVPVQTGVHVTDLPLVVLVNQGSASASEIVSGALQDAHRGALVGDTTFGTGTVLNEFGLPDGSALLLATEEWLTPSGRVIWHHGITPDQAVALPAGVDLLLPEAMQGLTPAQMQASGDAQLLRAISVLTTGSSK